ncbi:MAG: glycoside hydrolase family 3 N-terminal domain-containing protein [Anaerolineae bacterium]
MKKYWALLPTIVLFWIMGSVFIPVSFAQDEQSDFVLQQTQALLESLTPEERVGQLFLVTFEGSQLNLESDLVELITDYHVGGVVFTAENDNFSDSDSLITDIARTTNSLQELSIVGRSSRIVSSETTDEAQGELTDEAEINSSEEISRGVPLLIASKHGGGAYAEILDGLTEVPSQLSVGATWQPEMASITGRVLGTELNSLGFNLLLNPSLNLIENPELLRDINSNTLIDSYGGNSYWVGQFGQAFVNGIDEGSNGRIAVIGNNFPGSGSSDRPLNSEIATIRTTLLEMQQGDLAPFMQVADRANLTHTIDGFMTAHLRYQGFQGNIDARSAPLSFDAPAIETLLQLEPLSDWRESGGLLVSGELGVPAIRRFYAEGDNVFPHRRVARDSLLAGNDLLYVGKFASDTSETAVDNATEMDNVRDTIEWFNEQYASDPTFKLRVDEAVFRILQTKIRLYDGDLTLPNILIDEVSAESKVGIYESEITNIARQSVTQLSPRFEDNPEPLPGPPDKEDTVIIFTDSRLIQQCASCASIEQPGPVDLENRILSLYGPEGSNQVEDSQIFSFSFEDLEGFLNSQIPIIAPTPVPLTVTEPITIPLNFQVQEALNQADWVIFMPQGVQQDVSSSSALNRILTERPELISDQVVTVFSLGYPIDLDATDTSRLTAYYALYSPGAAFIDTAARVLFRDLSPRGALPLTINSVGYDLNSVVAPRPSQIIELFLEELPEIGDLGPPELFPGDTIRLRTGVILDYNGNPVPDGTIVQFTQEDRVQRFNSLLAEVRTIDGQASFDYVLEDRAGQFRLRASSGDAIVSEEVDIAIIENEGAEVVVITPTPAPTETPTPSPIPTVSITPSPTPTAIPTSTPSPPIVPEEPQINITLTELQTLGSLFLGLLGVGWVGSLSRIENRSMSGRLRKILWGFLFSLTGYIWFLTGMPGSGYLPSWGAWGWILVTFLCGLPGIVLAWLFNQIAENDDYE